MTNQKFFSIFFILSLLIFTSCDKDDDPVVVTNGNKVKTNLVTGDRGSHFEITRNGQTTTCKGDKVFGWEGGNLLNSARFKQLRMGCGENSFVFRISMPKDTVFENIAVDGHDLFQSRLLLEHSPNLAVVYPEFYFNDINPDVPGNAFGIVTIDRDVSLLETTYSLIGNIDVTFNNSGPPMTIKGQFWSKNAAW